ncbi:penicillin-binding protein activator [candidate division KSB1 bacterium]|nr:penicillin-binding protein activator [candidate division KSB1 bacterium]
MTLMQRIVTHPLLNRRKSSDSTLAVENITPEHSILTKILSRLFPVVLFVLILPHNLQAVSTDQVSTFRSGFDRALAFYHNEQYDQARSVLMSLTATTRGNAHITSAYLLLAAVLEKKDDFKAAERYLQILLRNFPHSRYVDHAYFALARHAYKNGQFGEALDHLLTIIERGKNTSLSTLSETIGCKIVASGIESSELEKLVPVHTAKLAQHWLTFWMIRCHLGFGRNAEAEALAEELMAAKPDQRFVRLTQQLLNRPASHLTYPLRIGIIMPLSGYAGADGREFLRGFAYALKQQPAKIELYIRDSKGNLNEAIKNMQELLRRNVMFFIGEMYGSTSASLAALAASADRPFLVPLATDNGIASLGHDVFQMNNDLETRGSALAKYAYEQLGLRSFATLAPADEYGQAVTDAFTNTIDALGGTIVAQQWYYAGALDFKRQFFAIRQSALRFSPRDSLAVAIYQDSLARAARLEQPELDYTYKPHRETVEDFEVPIRSIDGIFFPIYEEEINLIAPQFALAHIEAIPLGGEGWLTEKALHTQRRYIESLAFFAGKFVSETSMDYIQFKNRYRNVTNSSPGILAIYGYDLMRLLISAVQAGNISGEDIVTYFEKMKNYLGLGGIYSFSNDNHVNSAVNILQYRDGTLSQVVP